MNLVLSPRHLPRGIYRGLPTPAYPKTKTRPATQYEAEARSLVACSEFDPFEEDGRVGISQEGFPVPITDTVRILGVHFYRWFALDEHLTLGTHKAEVRQEVLARVARTRWGLERGVPMATHRALITSLLR